MNDAKRYFRCHQCGNKYPEEGYVKGDKLPKTFPMCSSRCHWIDLAQWLDPNKDIKIKHESKG